MDANHVWQTIKCVWQTKGVQENIKFDIQAIKVHLTEVSTILYKWMMYENASLASWLANKSEDLQGEGDSYQQMCYCWCEKHLFHTLAFVWVPNRDGQ